MRLGIGAGGDLTAQLDHIAEICLLEEIKQYNQPFIAISEEIGNVTSKINNSDESTLIFVIDPVDGSTNAIHGIPFSCISIAMASDETMDCLELGIVFDLNTGDVYWAEKGHGAYFNQTRISCSTIKQINHALIGIDFDHRNFHETFVKPHQQLVKNAAYFRMMGSCALELSLIAKGGIDLYIDLRSKLRIVDILAGLCILTEAGGFILNEKGEKFTCPNFSLDIRYNLIAGTPHLFHIISEKLEN